MEIVGQLKISIIFSQNICDAAKSMLRKKLYNLKCID